MTKKNLAFRWKSQSFLMQYDLYTSYFFFFNLFFYRKNTPNMLRKIYRCLKKCSHYIRQKAVGPAKTISNTSRRVNSIPDIRCSRQREPEPEPKVRSEKVLFRVNIPAEHARYILPKAAVTKTWGSFEKIF